MTAELEAREARAAADPYERWAGELLTSLLAGVEWVMRDVGSAGDGLHDLDVVFGDDSRIAVEVTTHTSEGRAAFDARLRSVNPVPAGSLRHHWTVGLVAPQGDAADEAAMHRMVDRARMEIVPILEQVEHEGLAHHMGSVGGVIEMPPGDPPVPDSPGSGLESRSARRQLCLSRGLAARRSHLVHAFMARYLSGA